jgi:hypothetical protein
MQPILAMTALLVLAGLTADGQERGGGGKEGPTDDTIIDLCGARLVRVFSRLGTPTDVFATRGDKAELDSVTLDYGSFGFRVRDKTVRACFFWSEWKDTVRGFRIGDGREQVVKALGNKYQAEKNNDGVDDYCYDLKDLDAMLWVDFDKDNKVVKVEVQLK